MKAVQKFSKEYLELCKKMRPEQIAQFLENFRLIHAKSGERSPRTRTRLISMKVEEPLLEAFKRQCELLGVPYQTQIKKIMRDWLHPVA